MSGREAIGLVARREVAVRLREKSFLYSTLISLAVIACVALLPNLLGFGGPDSYKIAVGDPGSRAVADAAVSVASASAETIVTLASNASAPLTAASATAREPGSPTAIL